MPSFEIPIRVYYEDTDFSGIVYHANYLRFFERGRTDALRASGITHTALLARTPALVFAVRRMVTEWIVPAKIDDLLVVETTFDAIKGARMFLKQTIRRDSQALAVAEVEAVCLTEAGRPIRLPDDLVRKLAT